ncbi:MULTISPECIES: serine O-acetyltransferase EpsC [Kordiimonas]|jgi:serine O-acetyltransferase|uniref:Serine O-acetyltransferase n=1 Tax=Kordiimonas lacus TaxID=637679 RepID=A0A1G7EEK2_9PROT|nr:MULTISPECIES: serine O-acetyltransferase EpsC [Kordiimonas]SDE62083.1 serine O-acetyltransferase [Kordiimonas lacus]
MTVTPKNQPSATSSFDDIAARLKSHHEKYGDLSGMSLGKIGNLLKKTAAVMFPHYAVAEDDDLSLEERLRVLEDSFYDLVDPLCRDEDVGCARLLVHGFLSDLPEIADLCYQDAQALVAGDPAAQSIEEVILCYPGFFAVVAYRLAHALHKRSVPLLPRMITEYAHQKTGADIHPGAHIGHSLAIDHATGVVIGETAIIGNNVKIYQGVTLGGLRVDPDQRSKKRHPTIGDNVVIYAGATILGGETVVGHNSVIGGNVWITRSVPAWSRVMFRPADTDEIVPMRSRKAAER